MLIDPNGVECILQSAAIQTNNIKCPKPEAYINHENDDLESIKSTFDSPIPLSDRPRESKKIAFLTSGGDSQGMNAAIRAIVRTAIAHKCHPIAIYDGYKGLISGEEYFRLMKWDDVAFVLSEVRNLLATNWKGGTVIRSSRCPEFMQKSYRRKAVSNLISAGVDKLIVIGGDGSLTGADTLRSEWAEHLSDLVKSGQVNEEVAKKYPYLMVVGLVGSIDNDMCGTEITIGANTSLHRITEAVDNIRSTAASHSQAFIVEVMGRHCGWLALNAALAVGADWLFIPERPPLADWKSSFCETLKRNREMGKRATIVILAEGAVDLDNQPIRAQHIQQTLIEKLSLDSRITTLGHVQRGGAPSAFDRYLGTVEGVRAVLALLTADPCTSPSLLIVKRENKVGEEVLRDCVERTRSLGREMKAAHFENVFSMRDPEFINGYELLHSLKASNSPGSSDSKTLAVMHCGAPCGGMNAATWAIVYYCHFHGHRVLGISNGFSGLESGDVRELELCDVEGWIWRGGSDLGTNRSQPTNMASIKQVLANSKIDGLIVIGGFEAFTSLIVLQNSVGVPMVCVPATVSNNVPGTDYSIGSDTALNVIVSACDAIKQSASSSRKRVFVVEVQGGNCGYLATMAGLSSGATYSYIPEEGLCLRDLQRDIIHFRKRFLDDKKQGRLVIRNEKVSATYTAELISKIFEEEARDEFDSRWTILGHLQQGSLPSPMDRIRAIRLAVLCIKRIEQNFSNKIQAAEIIGIRGPSVVFTSVSDLVYQVDLDKRICLKPWWMELRPIVKMLAKYGPVPSYFGI